VTGELVVVISPYHLTSREAPALAALQLADHCVTLLPAPGRTASPEVGRAVDAARAAPSYADLVESWRWSEQLFAEGVIAAGFEGEDAGEDAREACARIGTEGWLRSLRPLIRPEVFEDDRAYLAAVSWDVLRGGPDPALSIPLNAGLDAFAVRHELMVARAPATSVVQKAEARLARRLGSVAIPMLVQGSAERVLLARVLLSDALGPLRDALAALAAGEDADLTEPARAYTEAFAGERDDLLAPPGPMDDLDEVRPVEGLVSLSAIELPHDAVLTSSVSAAAMLERPRVGAPAASSSAAAVAGPGCVSLVVKVVGRG
jgi:hypothetical protein